MDRRKILLEKSQTFYDSLNSDELNLEIAKNLENIHELRELIMMKAREDFKKKQEQNNVFYFFKPANSIDFKPKSVYIFGFVAWYLAYKSGYLSQQSILYFIVGLNLLYYWKRQQLCISQKEYEDYKKINELYHHIVKLKMKSFKIENILNKSRGIKFEDFQNVNKLEYIKFEYLY